MEAELPQPGHMAHLYSLVTGPLPQGQPSPFPAGTLTRLCPACRLSHQLLRALRWKQAFSHLSTFPESEFLESRARDLGSWPWA